MLHRRTLKERETCCLRGARRHVPNGTSTAKPAILHENSERWWAFVNTATRAAKTKPGARSDWTPGFDDTTAYRRIADPGGIRGSSILLDDLGDDAGADGAATFADCEAQTFFHRDRSDQLH